MANHDFNSLAEPPSTYIHETLPRVLERPGGEN
jgi:hypothetical protein